MGYVFISYARRDIEFVKRLTSDMQKAGIDFWFDRQEIKPGDNWLRAIREAIANSETYIAVVSENSDKSSWVREEIVFADMTKKTIIFVILDDVRFQRPIGFADHQYVHFNTSVYEEAFNKLLDLIPRESKQERPSTPKEIISKGYVFVSYADEDSDFVDKLVKFLKERNYGYWDFRWSDRDYGSPFHIELETAIRKAEAMVCVVSPEWKSSIWTAKEYLFAEHKQIGTPTILLMYREVGATLLIVDRTYIDFTKDESQGFAKLDRELRRKGLI